MEKGFLEFERACTNANKYISYEKLVKKAVLDTRPVAYMNISDVYVANPLLIMRGEIIVFKIDGAYFGRALADSNLFINSVMLESFNKTPEQFISDINDRIDLSNWAKKGGR